jgi:2-dehydro-3-deoxyphosphogluconate aldolase/(4S)-4-hydroxy-2-oxoglutarate aldolase
VTTSGLADLQRAAIIAVLRAPDPDTALRTVDALVQGGVTGIEVTYSTPDAASVIRRVGESYGDDVVLGAGTVLDEQQATEAVEAGARFLVSPGTQPDLAEAMVATGATVLLGALTPSELMQARSLGADGIKIFPASVGGPGFLRALRGPFPDVPLVPTGGVSPGNVAEWLDAGAVAVGAGGELCSAAAMRAGRFADITERAREFTGAVRQWQRR